jgi:hypothetical protein
MRRGVADEPEVGIVHAAVQIVVTSFGASFGFILGGACGTAVSSLPGAPRVRARCATVGLGLTQLLAAGTRSLACRSFACCLARRSAWRLSALTAGAARVVPEGRAASDRDGIGTGLSRTSGLPQADLTGSTRCRVRPIFERLAGVEAFGAGATAEQYEQAKLSSLFGLAAHDANCERGAN